MEQWELGFLIVFYVKNEKNFNYWKYEIKKSMKKFAF